MAVVAAALFQGVADADNLANFRESRDTSANTNVSSVSLVLVSMRRSR